MGKYHIWRGEGAQGGVLFCFKYHFDFLILANRKLEFPFTKSGFSVLPKVHLLHKTRDIKYLFPS